MAGYCIKFIFKQIGLLAIQIEKLNGFQLTSPGCRLL